MIWKTCAAVVAIVLAMLIWAAAVAQPPKGPAKEPPKAAVPKDVRDFMRLKLDHSQEILEGLATEDFEEIAKHSREIGLLSQATTWQVLQSSEYLQHSREFRRTADDLNREAKSKNLDGAALKYVEMTLKCVSCHKYVRGVRMAAIDDNARLSLAMVERGR